MAHRQDLTLRTFRRGQNAGEGAGAGNRDAGRGGEKSHAEGQAHGVASVGGHVAVARVAVDLPEDVSAFQAGLATFAAGEDILG